MAGLGKSDGPLIRLYRRSGPQEEDSNQIRICQTFGRATELHLVQRHDSATLVYMQEKKGAQLRKEWAEKGSPPCVHPTLAKEYFLGADSEDSICTTCGETWWRNDPDRPETSRYPKRKKDS